MEADNASNTRYSKYVLAVLFLVYILNFLDRQILAILAEDIRADLGLSDASIGFLYGTAFAIFYALFGIPLARLADISVRKNIIAAGLALWSAMTALSGTARSFGSLAFFRVGVGIGESSASPAAFSMLGDYFPPRMRATVMAFYSSGVYVGGGIGIFLGGLIVDRWNAAFEAGGAPFGLAGWQAAFMIVGLPGLLVALWVWTLREPVRGGTEGLTVTKSVSNPGRQFAMELASVLPGLSLVTLARISRSRGPVLLNLVFAVAIAAAAAGLTRYIGRPVQWIGLGIGVYAFLTWTQVLVYRDPAAFDMVYRSRSVVFGEIGFGWVAFVAYGFSLWMPPYFMRTFGVSATEVGVFVGLVGAAGGFFGATVGGIISDRMKLATPRARPYAGMIAAVGLAVSGSALLATHNLYVGYVFVFVESFFSAFWIGSAVALANEIVLPRMRATASAFYILCVTFVGLALGPFLIGRMSDAVATMNPDVNSLKYGMFGGLGATLLAVLFFWLSCRHVEDEEKRRLQRAEALGEPIRG